MTTSKRAGYAARAIADTTSGIVLARVDIAVPPERVWEALTTSELTAWWGSAELYQTTSFTIDLRPGGSWRTDGMGADGHAFHVAGKVLEVERPRRLVQTWEPSWEPGDPTTIAYMLEPIPTGTSVTVRHTGFTNPAACGDHAAGWERVFGWLGSHLAAPATTSYYMCKLVAPRPSFIHDMTADERAVMQAHSGYWRDKLAAGTVIAFGPVADPAGAFGLGIVAVPDEATLAQFIAGDPAVSSNIGMRYETFPMVTAVY